MKWNKETHKEQMKLFVQNLVNSLNKKGIEFKEIDGELENVIFSNGDKILKLAHHCFYRYSGIASIFKEVKGSNNKEFETIIVTDEMWLNLFIKPIIENKLLK